MIKDRDEIGLYKVIQRGLIKYNRCGMNGEMNLIGFILDEVLEWVNKNYTRRISPEESMTWDE